MRARNAKTEVNGLPQLQLRIVKNRAPLRKTRTFALPEGVRNRWQPGRLEVVCGNLPTVPDTA